MNKYRLRFSIKSLGYHEIHFNIGNDDRVVLYYS